MSNIQPTLWNDGYDSLVDEITSCDRCARMEGCTRVISWANGNVQAPMMFIGEAPGRLGADRTAIPFHGDKAGDNFEALLSTAGIGRADIFVTNAVMCNPRDESGNNSPPSKKEIENCASNLKKQIDFVQPKIVMTLGAVALSATSSIEDHSLKLKDAVRKKFRWYGRWLLPLYHPGARAMIHRSFANQTSDYYFVQETFKRLASPPVKRRFVERGDLNSWGLVEYIIRQFGECSLFRLHKTLYLIDLEARARLGRPATSFFYIRQKDGPYCVELGGRWYNRFAGKIKIIRGDRPILKWNSDDLFVEERFEIERSVRSITDDLIAKMGSLDDQMLKTKTYLSQPMRRILKLEKSGYSTLNRPLFA